MKEVVIKKERAGEVSKWTLAQKFFAGWTIANLIISIGIALYAVISKWGNGTVALVWLFILGAYIIIFALILSVSKKNNPKEFRRRLKNYLAGVKILTQLSNLISLIVSAGVLLSAFIGGDVSTRRAIITLSILLLFTVGGFVVNIMLLVRRHRKKMREY